jgi:hypothetical protein
VYAALGLFVLGAATAVLNARWGSIVPAKAA